MRLSHIRRRRSMPLISILSGALLWGPACAVDGDLSWMYLGETPPDRVPRLFAPGIVSTEARELNAVFSPNGRELYLARAEQGPLRMYWSRLESGLWTAPEELDLIPGQPAANAVDMMLSLDGERLYFLSNAENPHFPLGSDNIWVSHRQESGWGPAEVLPSPVNSVGSEVYPVLVRDGSMYFSSTRPGGYGGYDVYRSQFRDGEFLDAVNLGQPINSGAHEGDPFVDPDETYLILAAQREGNLGQFDLHVSFRGPDGNWGELIHMGSEINSQGWDYAPMVSPDGRFLFFSRRGEAGWDVYWVDAGIIEDFRLDEE